MRDISKHDWNDAASDCEFTLKPWYVNSTWSTYKEGRGNALWGWLMKSSLFHIDVFRCASGAATACFFFLPYHPLSEAHQPPAVTWSGEGKWSEPRMSIRIFRRASSRPPSLVMQSVFDARKTWTSREHLLHWTLCTHLMIPTTPFLWWGNWAKQRLNSLLKFT